MIAGFYLTRLFCLRPVFADTNGPVCGLQVVRLERLWHATTVATLEVINSWNLYFLPLLVLNDEALWPLGIMQFQGQYGTDWARIMAYVMLLIVPAVAFYLVTEKYIVTGLTGGELKG